MQLCCGCHLSMIYPGTLEGLTILEIARLSCHVGSTEVFVSTEKPKGNPENKSFKGRKARRVICPKDWAQRCFLAHDLYLKFIFLDL